jgi:hypothetical protein
MPRRVTFEILALGVFATIVVAMTVSGSTTTAYANQGSPCTLALNGSYLTLQRAPAGSWSLTSSACSITSQASGITSGTFSGTLTSGTGSLVTGTWSVAGSQTQVSATGVNTNISFTVNTPVDQLPMVGSSYQGVATDSAGQMLLTTGITGQVSLGQA